MEYDDKPIGLVVQASVDLSNNSSDELCEFLNVTKVNPVRGYQKIVSAGFQTDAVELVDCGGSILTYRHDHERKKEILYLEKQKVVREKELPRRFSSPMLVEEDVQLGDLLDLDCGARSLKNSACKLCLDYILDGYDYAGRTSPVLSLAIVSNEAQVDKLIVELMRDPNGMVEWIFGDLFREVKESSPHILPYEVLPQLSSVNRQLDSKVKVWD